MKRVGAAIALFAVACESTEETAKSREALLDPATCKECHEDHYREWSASMHAYAGSDPVFLAMNARGQRETDGELGDFCVSCHAPMAVREGLTNDDGNLDDVPDHLKGVTCYFCHNVEAVEGTHNNPLVLANDTTMRGNIADPVDSPAHDADYSRLHDSNAKESADLCGACHDIVVPAKFSGADEDVHLERTFSEWKDGFFATIDFTCANCHMTRIADVPVASFEGVGNRVRHTHGFPAVDVALTPFPADDPEAQAEYVQAVQTEVDQTLVRTQVCVYNFEGVIEVTLDNFIAGHGIPSGAAQDRRLWVEVRAFDANDQEIYSSGVLEDPLQPVVDLRDPEPWLFRDETFDKDGNPAHMFWDVARIENKTIPGVEYNTPFKPDGTPVETFREVVTQTYAVPPAQTERVTVRVRLQPMGLDVLGDLVESGDLEERFLDAMPIHDVLPNREDESVTVEWRSGSVDCVTSGRDR